MRRRICSRGRDCPKVRRPRRKRAAPMASTADVDIPIPWEIPSTVRPRVSARKTSVRGDRPAATAAIANIAFDPPSIRRQRSAYKRSGRPPGANPGPGLKVRTMPVKLSRNCSIAISDRPQAGSLTRTRSDVIPSTTTKWMNRRCATNGKSMRRRPSGSRL